MRVINGNYEILDKIIINRCMSQYKVFSLNEKKIYILSIWNSEIMSLNMRKYLCRNFKSIRNLNCEGVYNIYDLIIVKEIDGVVLEEKEYGYLSEWADDYREFDDFIKECSEVEKKEIFMKIAIYLNTLNRRGYIYKRISTIKLKEIDGEIKVKLPDILSSEINYMENYSIDKYGIDFRENINLGIKKSNIYELITIYKKMFSKEGIDKELDKIIDDQINDKYNVDSFYDIDDLISYINIKLSSNYQMFHYDSISKVTKDIDLSGRKVEIDNIMKVFEKNKCLKIKSRIIFYSGVMGIGKTSFLNEIERRLTFIYDIPVLYIPKMGEVDKLIETREFLKRKIQENLKIEFCEEIDKFIENISRKDEDYTLEETRLNYRIMNNGAKILEKYSKISPIVILIDNLEKYNMFFKMYLKHIASNLKSMDNVMIISTVESFERETELERMIFNLKSEVDIAEYKLDLFNEYYTKDMVSKLVNSNDVDSIAKIIHHESLGNPSIIEENIIDSFKEKSLYVSKKTGQWIYEFEKEKSILPKKFELDYKNKLNLMEEDEFYILKRLSTFNLPIPKELIINEIISNNENSIYAFYRIRDDNILIKSFTDKGVIIGFKDYFYKRLIYKNLTQDERIKFHRLNLEVLEKAEKYDGYYTEEILYQLEQGKEYDKMILKGREYGNKLTKEGNEEKAIEIYKSIINYTDTESYCNIAYKIADLYRKVEEYRESYHYYEISNNIAIYIRNFDIEIKSLIFMTYIEIEKRNFDAASIALDEIETKVFRYNHVLGEAYLYYLRSLYMYSLGLKAESIYIAKRGLYISRYKGLELIKCRLDAFLFKYNIENNKYNDTRKDIEHSLDIFMENGEWKEYLNTLINTGIYLVEVEYKLEEAEAIFKDALKYGEIRKIVKVQFKALINLSHISIIKFDFEAAEKYTKNAINLIKSNKNLESYMLSAYWNLIYIYGLSGKIIDMIKLKNTIDGQLDSYKLNNSYILDLSIVKPSYYYYINDYEKCNNELLNLNLNKSDKILSNKIFNLGIRIMSLYGASNDDAVNLIKEILNDDKINKKLKNSLFIESIIYLCKMSKKELAKQIIRDVDILDITDVSEGKYVQIQFIYRDYQMNTLINRGLRILATTNNEVDKLTINYMIGEGYKKIKSNVKAIYYYYEAINILIKQIKVVSKESKLRYINISNFIILYNKFVRLLRDCFDIKLEYILNDSFTSLGEFEYYIDKISVENLFEIAKFKEVLVKDYEKTYYNYNNDINYVLNLFSDNILNNIELILKYIANKTLSTAAVITYNDKNGENKIIASYRIKEKKYLQKKLNEVIRFEEYIINDNKVIKNKFLNDLGLDDIKGCLYACIKSDKKNNIKNKKNIGQILLLSDKVLNNIDNKSMEAIRNLEPLLIFLIEQYKINMESTRDKLTGAFNRAYFEKAYEEIIDYSNYKKSIFSLVLFDIDDFKGVNDGYGHLVGDMVLKNISDIVHDCSSKEDIFCRYGGEEFILILPMKDEKIAYKQSELIRSKIEEADILKGKRSLTISLGIATYKVHSINKSELVKKADEALYEAKKRGKNRVEIWDSEFSKQSEYNDKLAGVLTGNSARDYDKVASILEIVSIAKSSGNKLKKIYEILKTIIIKTDSTKAYMFFVDDDRILNIKKVEKDKEGWQNIGYFNKDIVKKVRVTKEGMYTVDWDEIKEIGSLDTIPKWHSICVIPLINNEKLKGILYISAPAHIKEYEFNDFNYVTTLAEILSILL